MCSSGPGPHESMCGTRLRSTGSMDDAIPAAGVHSGPVAPGSRCCPRAEIGARDHGSTTHVAENPTGHCPLLVGIRLLARCSGYRLGGIRGSGPLDGSVARAAGEDDAVRRGLDSIVDRTTVTAFFGVVALSQSWAGVAAWIMLFCNLGLMAVALNRYRAGFVVKAPSWHRVWSALFGVAALLTCFGNDLARPVAGLGVVAFVACSLDLARGAGQRLALSSSLPRSERALVAARFVTVVRGMG